MSATECRQNECTCECHFQPGGDLHSFRCRPDRRCPACAPTPPLASGVASEDELRALRAEVRDLRDRLRLAAILALPHVTKPDPSDPERVTVPRWLWEASK